MKRFFTIILLALFGFIGISCTDYLDVNNNVDAPDYVDDYLYLAGIEACMQGFYYDIRALGPITQMMGTSSYTNFAGHYYSLASDAGGELWRLNYWLQGMNLENMISEAKEAGHWTLVGIGYTLKAYSWDKLTKYHAEAPLRQAYVSGILSHTYEYQPEIYDSVRTWANRAIEYLEMEDDSLAYGSHLTDYDLIYGGDSQKWLKFAHGIIVSNLTSLTRKNNFTSDYAQDLITHYESAIQETADDALFYPTGGGSEAKYSSYNNFWGTNRGNLGNSYWQHDYIVQIMTGTIPQYDKTTGKKVRTEIDEPEEPKAPVDSNGTGFADSLAQYKLDSIAYEKAYRRWAYYPYEYESAAVNIIADTSVHTEGHFDPRVAAKLATTDGRYYLGINDRDSVVALRYYGSGKTSSSGPISTAPNFYGRASSSSNQYEGSGRWLYRDDAPYIFMTAAELAFDVAEAYFVLGQKDKALEAWKRGIEQDMAFTVRWLDPGSPSKDGDDYVINGGRPGGDKITSTLFNELAEEYMNGPFVADVTSSTLTLSHIMMQKYIALFPWGAHEAWVDLRKYHYDINYTGEYPSYGNGWQSTSVDTKWDTDDSKVFKGFYLYPTQVENRTSSFASTDNNGSPCYRIRPRYNSEYMWNLPALGELKPIAGTAENYHCSIPWFAYPGDYPESL